MTERREDDGPRAVEEREIPSTAPTAPVPADEERPPLGSWRRLYALVLGELALLVVLFYLFGRAFSGALAP